MLGSGPAARARIAAAADADCWSAIVDNAAAAYLAIDNDDVLLFASAAARRMLEVGESDVGRPFQDLSVSYRPIELRSQIEDVRRQMRPIRIEHQEYHRPPGDPIRLTIEVAPLIARDGGSTRPSCSPSPTPRAPSHCSRSWKPRRKVWRRRSRNCSRPTRNWRPPTRNCSPPTRNWKPPTRSCNPPTRNWRPPTRSCAPPTRSWRRRTRSCGAIPTSSLPTACTPRRILRGLDAGVIVVDTDLKVRSWNRWSENIWGLREEEAIDQSFGALDIGLPVQQVEPALTTGSTRWGRE